MSQSNSPSETRNEAQSPDWKEVVVEVILKILTLGFYHIEKHRKNQS